MRIIVCNNIFLQGKTQPEAQLADLLKLLERMVTTAEEEDKTHQSLRSSTRLEIGDITQAEDALDEEQVCLKVYSHALHSCGSV